MTRSRMYASMILAGLISLVVGFLMDPFISWYNAYYGTGGARFFVIFWVIAGGIALIVLGHLLLVPRMLARTAEKSEAEIPKDGAGMSSGPSGWTVNGWCIAGLLIALGPILVAWAEVRSGSSCIFDRNLSIIEVLRGQMSESEAHPILMSSVVFLVGTAIALVTPLGSAVQVSGTSMLMIFGTLEEVPHQSLCANPVDVWIGATLALLSSAFLIVGLILPLGIGRGLKRSYNHPRYWTLGRSGKRK